MTLLRVERLKKSYSGRPVVRDLSFSLEKGEVVGLLGPNGAGKTTAFYMTMGLLRPDSGKVFFNDEDVTRKPVYKRARMGIGYLAQEPSVFRGLSVEQNILCILETCDLSKQERKVRLEELLCELNLQSLAKKKAATLSGGERRRLEITRALAKEPALLLLDEPFANIDPLSIEELKELISHLSEKGISVLITDHNAREIFSVTKRCYLIQEGSVLLEGTPTELRNNPIAKQHYLGQNFDINERESLQV